MNAYVMGDFDQMHVRVALDVYVKITHLCWRHVFLVCIYCSYLVFGASIVIPRAHGGWVMPEECLRVKRGNPRVHVWCLRWSRIGVWAIGSYQVLAYSIQFSASAAGWRWLLPALPLAVVTSLFWLADLSSRVIMSCSFRMSMWYYEWSYFPVDGVVEEPVQTWLRPGC
jgi:hypothetical protein